MNTNITTKTAIKYLGEKGLENYYILKFYEKIFGSGDEIPIKLLKKFIKDELPYYIDDHILTKPDKKKHNIYYNNIENIIRFIIWLLFNREIVSDDDMIMNIEDIYINLPLPTHNCDSKEPDIFIKISGDDENLLSIGLKIIFEDLSIATISAEKISKDSKIDDIMFLYDCNTSLNFTISFNDYDDSDSDDSSDDDYDDYDDYYYEP